MKKKIRDILEYARNGYDSIKNPTVFTIMVLISCYISFHVLQEQIGIVARVLIYVLAYIGAQNIENILSEIKKYFFSMFDKMILVLICAISTFCETGAYYLEPIYDYRVPILPFFVLSSIWISVIVLFIIYEGHRLIGKYIAIQSNGFSTKANVIMVIMCVSICMLCNYAFNPAITSSDSLSCYNAAFHLGEGPIPNGHPVFYIMLIRLLIHICPKIQFLILVQAVYYALVLTYIINTLVQLGVRKRLCLFIFLFVGLGFNTIIQVVTFWKDIPFTTSLVWLTALLVKMCANQQRYSRDWLWYVQYVVSALLTALLRHNGLLPVIITLLLAVFILDNKKRIIESTIIVLIVIIVVKGPIYKKYHVYETPGLKYYAMANDIVYLYHYSDYCDEQIIQVVYDATDGNMDNFFSPYYTYVMLTGERLNRYSIPEFIKAYMHAWYINPKIMLRGFLSRNAVIWSIDRTAYEMAGCVNYLGENHDEQYERQFSYRKENFLTRILTKVFTKLTENHFVYTFYWRTPIYNLLMIVGILVIIIKYKMRFLLPVLPFAPIGVNTFVLLMTSGWPDYRYYWPSMLVATVLIPYTLCVLSKKDRIMTIYENN